MGISILLRHINCLKILMIDVLFFVLKLIKFDKVKKRGIAKWIINRHVLTMHTNAMMDVFACIILW